MDDATDLLVLITIVMFVSVNFGPSGRGNVRFVLVTFTS